MGEKDMQAGFHDEIFEEYIPLGGTDFTCLVAA